MFPAIIFKARRRTISMVLEETKMFNYRLILKMRCPVWKKYELLSTLINQKLLMNGDCQKKVDIVSV